MWEPLMPAWLVLPLAIALLTLVGRHTLRVSVAPISPSTRRIRTSAGLVMLTMVPALTYGLCIADSYQPKAFVVAWLLTLGLTLILIVLATADMANNVRLYMMYQRESRRQARATLHERIARRSRTPSITRRHQPANDRA